MSDLNAEIEAKQHGCADALKKGDLPLAISLLNNAWDLAESNNSWRMRLARNFVTIYMREKCFAEAQEWLAKLRPFYDQPGEPDPTMEFIQGTLFFESGDMNQAKEVFTNLHKNWGKRPFAGSEPKYLAFCLGK